MSSASKNMAASVRQRLLNISRQEKRDFQEVLNCKETTISEKLHAIIVLGLENSRMKDYFDLWLLSRDFSFTGLALSGAVRATFMRNGTQIPLETPAGLTHTFSEDSTKRLQWRGFVKQRVTAPTETPQLEEIVTHIAGFLLPVLRELAGGEMLREIWLAGGPWQAGSNDTST